VNKLAEEASPYLRQHAENPVEWYPWGAEAFDEARRRDVPVLISVGYSSCHWCHVMAHESFEDADVAAKMNELFVNVKVDREERPDVDAIYMDAVQAQTGRGGWPMTVFATPAGEPFFGGTYFPKLQFLSLLDGVDDAWRTKRPELANNVTALTDAVRRSGSFTPGSSVPGYEPVNAALKALASSFDREWGGFGAAPKFPATMNLELVMRAHLHKPSEANHLVVTTTLDAMASGGMYDHLGGGFSRYSVDAHWIVPHFEKMLYDQASLVRAYTRAYALYRHEPWRQIVAETVDYVAAILHRPGGGFYSAEDADSLDETGHSVEGAFYTWTPDEARAVLVAGGLADDEITTVTEWFGITGEPNFEERSIPNRLHARGRWARPGEIERGRQLLFDARATRPRPGLDDKVLTEWNAMMIGALAEAGFVFDESAWIDLAVESGEFLLDELRGDDGRWSRSWHEDAQPHARHRALAADHAALVDAFVRLGEASGQARWTTAAVEVADAMLDHFWDVGDGGLFTVPDDGPADGTPLIVRQKDVVDGAVPSANSTAALGLGRLAALTGEPRFAQHADRILTLMAPLMQSSPTAFCVALAALDQRRTGIVEVVVPGSEHELLDALRSTWRPDVVLAHGEPFDSPLWEGRLDGNAYVCEHGACQLPVTDADGLEQQLAGRGAAT